MFTNCRKLNPIQSEKIKLHYFPIAGRGELSKLIAVVGGLDLEIVHYGLEIDDPEAEYKLKAKELGFDGFGLPILEEGSFTINQSGAIQDYLVSKGKLYPKLTKQQIAIDNLFSYTLEDAITGASSVMFKVNEPDILIPLLDKLVSVLNYYIPETGFIHGLDTPSKADLCVLILLEGTMPFRVANKVSEINSTGERYPRLQRLVDRVKNYPRVKDYLESTECTLKKGPV